MGNDTKLTTFTLASDYAPAHYNWPEEELATLGDCKATAEVIKKRLEDNGVKVMEMYAIEHKGEKTADSKSENQHKGTDKTKPHYHILVKFEEGQGATLKEIAKYIGVLPEIIEKLKPGAHSYHNMLAYLTHIKYQNKIQYAPEDVVTLTGTDYMVHYNKHKESWIKARAIVEEKGGKPLDRRFREAIKKLESGELSCEELAGMPEYRPLFLNAKYQRELKEANKRVKELAYLDSIRLGTKLQNKEISKEEAKTREEYRLAFKYHSNSIV